MIMTVVVKLVMVTMVIMMMINDYKMIPLLSSFMMIMIMKVDRIKINDNHDVMVIMINNNDNNIIMTLFLVIHEINKCRKQNIELFISNNLFCCHLCFVSFSVLTKLYTQKG